MWTDGLCKLVW